MKHEWYYEDRDLEQEVGPVEEEEIGRLLREGKLDAESLVWMDEMDDWEELGETPLKNLLKVKARPEPVVTKVDAEATEEERIPPKLPRRQLPAGPIAQAEELVQSNGTIVRILLIALTLQLLLEPLNLVALVQVNEELTRIQGTETLEDDTEVTSLNSLAFYEMIKLLVRCFMSVIFFVWLFRTSLASQILMGPHRFSAPWLVGSFFIPIMDLIWPFQGLKELIRNLRYGGGTGALPWTFWGYWLVFLGMFFSKWMLIFNVFSDAGGAGIPIEEALQDPMVGVRLNLLDSVLSIPYWICLIGLVRYLQRVQEWRLEKISAERQDEIQC